MIFELLLLGAIAFNNPTADPGAEICMDISGVQEMEWHVGATANDEEGNTSALSNVVLKNLPGEVCWQNPTENVDGTTLTDLASVTVLLSEDGDFTGEPTQPPFFEIQVDCTVVDCADVQLIIAYAGDPIDLSWTSENDGPYTIQIFKYPDGTFPVAQGTSEDSTYSWIPNQAGMFYVDVTGQSTQSVLNSVFAIQLSTPGGGGVIE